jgi:[ribosomal protein S18]-alanine N-acetyltransferase
MSIEKYLGKTSEETDPDIKEMMERDIDAVMRIEKESFPEYSYWRNTDSFKAYVNKADCKSWVLCVDGEITGYALIKIEESESVLLAKMAVASTSRGQGIGRRFIKHIKKYSVTHKVGKIRLNVRSSNQEAIKLYECTEFKKVGEGEAYEKGNTPEDKVKVEMEWNACGK